MTIHKVDNTSIRFNQLASAFDRLPRLNEDPVPIEESGLTGDSVEISQVAISRFQEDPKPTPGGFPPTPPDPEPPGT